jgi:pyruvate kinase
MKRIDTRTKILATLGPASANKKVLSELIDAGVDAIRLNFSHGTHNDFKKMFDLIDEVCKLKKLPIAILQDLQGPKIRIGDIEENRVEIKKGAKIKITTRDVIGTKDMISTSYKALPKDAKIGNTILIDDGLISLKVLSKTKTTVTCKVIEGGVLKSRKGMNLPGMKLSTAAMTERDLENLKFALKFRVDYIALSFVRHPQDIIDLRTWLEAQGHKKPIIAKIEKPEAVEDFEAILQASDGIMVARGDLGVEISPQSVPLIQKQIIRRCNEVGKLVITATQMLESMIDNPIPTRAEASDVANAVWDGTDVVMLSGETSIGEFPKATVKIMNDILDSIESKREFGFSIDYEQPTDNKENVFDAVGKAVTDISHQINASLIVVFTHYGKKARSISKFRPNARIVSFSDSFDVMNTLNLHWGIMPYFMKDIDSEEKCISEAKKIIIKEKLVKKGDVVIFTAGTPSPNEGRTSWMRSAII